MPGTLTIKPVQADLHCNKDLFKKMDPYCEFLIGGQKFKTSVCHRGGKHPHWSDTFTAHVNNETKMHVRMLDKDTFKNDDYIGMCEIDLQNVAPNSQQWYPVYCQQNSIGEILLEISYTPQGQLPNQQFIGQPQLMPVQQGIQQPQMMFSNPTFCPPEQMQTNSHTAQPIMVFNCPAFSNESHPMTVYPQGQQMGQSVQHNHPPTHSVSIRSFETSNSDIAYAPTLSTLNSIAMSQSQSYSGPRQGA